MKRKIISVLLCVALIVSVTPVVYAQNTIDVTLKYFLCQYIQNFRKRMCALLKIADP